MAAYSRQVDRTRRLLLDAFAQLLTQVPPDELGVAQITETADVSRQSFYRHFGDIDALAAAYFDRIFDEYEDALRHHSGEGEPAAYRMLFRTLHAHAAELLVFGNDRMRPRLFAALLSYQARLQAYASEIDPASDEAEYVRAMIAYQSGGTAAVITQWVAQGMTVAPDEIADTLAEVQGVFRDRRQFLPAILAGRNRHEEGAGGTQTGP